MPLGTLAAGRLACLQHWRHGNNLFEWGGSKLVPGHRACVPVHRDPSDAALGYVNWSSFGDKTFDPLVANLGQGARDQQRVLDSPVARDEGKVLWV